MSDQTDLPKEPADRGPATSSVHAGELRQQEANAITTPIYQTSTFWFRNSKEVTDYQEGKSDREEYGRYGNPTWRAVERKISALEGGEETILFASGMCAATTTFMALLPEGSHLIVTSDCYRRTRQFIEQFLVAHGRRDDGHRAEQPRRLQGGDPAQHGALLHRVARPIPTCA